MIVHAAIHSGRDQQWSARRQRCTRQQTIRLTVSQLGNRIRRARRNDEQIGGVPQPHMQNMRFVSPEIFICIGAPAGDRLKRERCDEILRRAREDHVHLRAGLCQLGRQIRGFIGRDRTGDAKYDSFVRQDGHMG